MKIVTSLSFRGQCKEAFEFYARVLGGRITAAFPYGEGPPDMPVGPQYKDWLMHAWLEVGDQSIMGADMDTDWAPHIEKPKNGFDVTLHYDDAAEAKRIFDALSEGGQVIMDFSPPPSGRRVMATSSTNSACRGWSIRRASRRQARIRTPYRSSPRKRGPSVLGDPALQLTR